MRLGILETGRVPEGWEDRHGTYLEQFSALFHSADPDVTLVPCAVIDGVFPERPDACDAWLVTGSKYGVYDSEPWIEPLKAFLRAARAAGVPMIGICFGHQIMAEAFGGRAEKSEKGWGCGVHEYALEVKPGWLDTDASALTMYAMHQDQVTALAPDATRLASSAFCENAMLTYGDPERPDAISIQPHPEFARDYARDLVAFRSTTHIPDAVADRAMQSFGGPTDGAAFARWSLAYLRAALARRAAA